MASCPLRTHVLEHVWSSPWHRRLIWATAWPFYLPLSAHHSCPHLLQPHWPPFSSLKMSNVLCIWTFIFSVSLPENVFPHLLCGLLILFKSLLKCHFLRLSRIPHLKYMIFPSCLYAVILIYIMTLSVGLPAQQSVNANEANRFVLFTCVAQP